MKIKIAISLLLALGACNKEEPKKPEAPYVDDVKIIGDSVRDVLPANRITQTYHTVVSKDGSKLSKDDVQKLLNEAREAQVACVIALNKIEKAGWSITYDLYDHTQPNGDPYSSYAACRDSRIKATFHTQVSVGPQNQNKPILTP